MAGSEQEISEQIETSGGTSESDSSSGASVPVGAPVITSAEAPPSESKTPSFPSADEFNWDSWSGEMDSLPEQIRPWSQRVWDYRQTQVEKDLSEGREESERLQKIYAELLDGQEDPRVREHSTTIEKLNKQLEELRTSSEVTKSEYEEYKTAVEKAVEAEARAQADAFKAAYPEIFSDKAKLDIFAKLLEEGWELDNIPKVMALSPESAKVASEARRDGVADHYAMKLADGVRSKPPAPRPSASITSGSGDRTMQPHGASAGMGDAKTFDEQRSYAVQRAMKLHGGGRK